ncbi:hypothetical protein MRX96_017752 [Rhipicephalus microplus]
MAGVLTVLRWLAVCAPSAGEEATVARRCARCIFTLRLDARRRHTAKPAGRPAVGGGGDATSCRGLSASPPRKRSFWLDKPVAEHRNEGGLEVCAALVGGKPAALMVVTYFAPAALSLTATEPQLSPREQLVPFEWDYVPQYHRTTTAYTRAAMGVEEPAARRTSSDEGAKNVSISCVASRNPQREAISWPRTTRTAKPARPNRIL